MLQDAVTDIFLLHRLGIHTAPVLLLTTIDERVQQSGLQPEMKRQLDVKISEIAGSFERLKDFQKTADSYNKQFEKLVDEYTQNRSAYNVDEQKQIRSAIAKYVGLAAKSGVKTAIDAINGVIEQIPSLLEGIGGFFKDLGLGTEEKPE